MQVTLEWQAKDDDILHLVESEASSFPEDAVDEPEEQLLYIIILRGVPVPWGVWMKVVRDHYGVFDLLLWSYLKESILQLLGE